MSYNVVCHGNSITQGATQVPFPEQLGTLLGVTSKVYNRGTGSITTQMLYDEFVSVVHPLFVPGANNVVVFWEASNSFTGIGWTVDDEQTLQQEYILQARALGWKVIIANVIQRGLSQKLEVWRVQIVEFNDWMKLNARDLADGFIDMWSLNTDFQNEFDGNGPVASYIDAAHLNTTRYGDIAADILLELPVAVGEKIGVDINGSRARVWPAYEGKTFSLDGINFYHDNNGIGESVAPIGLTSYTLEGAE